MCLSVGLLVSNITTISRSGLAPYQYRCVSCSKSPPPPKSLPLVGLHPPLTPARGSQVNQLDRNHEHRRLLHEAKHELKKSKRKDYYKILNLGRSATTDEIKKAYRKQALVHHPGK